MKNLKRNSDAAHEAVYGAGGMKTGDGGVAGESDEMGPMILGDYNVHQTTSTPATSSKERSMAGEAMKLAIAAGIATTGVGLPAAIAVQALWPREKEAVEKARFDDESIELVLPYASLQSRK